MNLRLPVRASSAWARVMRASSRSIALTFPTGVAFAGTPRESTNIFEPVSTPAQNIWDTSLLVLVICAAIFVTVAGLLVYTIIRFRRRPNDDGREPPQVYGSDQIELAWTVLPILIVFVLILVTARTIADVQNAVPPPGTLHATVIGHQSG